ncbi:DnaJ family domain-containing protein [Paenibacillus humicola]|uniref:DnaJ family domain-containing protein n=1 Tax=Paenibacillus humicola TaxID=3110540 RepID=UPI00237B9C05|nr:DnaJ family domain-containing protein [Paenibacillus humicola]
MDAFSRIAEERIREAMARGEFDNLPGAGKPLELEELSHVPEDLRLSYKLLKNAGAIPPELQLAKELATLHDLIALCKTEADREPLRKQLSEKRLRFRMFMESQGLGSTEAFRQYERQIRSRLEEEGEE